MPRKVKGKNKAKNIKRNNSDTKTKKISKIKQGKVDIKTKLLKEIKDNKVDAKIKQAKENRAAIKVKLHKEKEKIKTVIIKNKIAAVAIAFSFVMFVAGVYAILDYQKASDMYGAVDDLNSSIVAQNNPLIVQTTSICSMDMDNNSNGKLMINPAVTPFLSAAKYSFDIEEEKKSVDISLAPSMKALQNDLSDTYLFDSKDEVYEMLIDGKVVAAFSNPDEPRQVIDKILEKSINKKSELLSLEYKESFKVEKSEKTFLNRGKTFTVDEAAEYLMTGTREEHQYTVVSGDIPESIAESHGMTLDELEKANPEIVGRGHLLQIGQKLRLEVPVPMLTLITVERQKYSDYKPFEVTKIKSANIYEGESRIKVRGKKGERQVVAEVRKENGREIERVLVSEELISEPVGQVVLVGTKPAPPKKGTGSFMVPLSRGYVITSNFGPRWGRLHKGIDMGCPTGSPILAADGGVVYFAGYQGSYGYVVKIDHGANFKSVYAHCSKLFVTEGQKVFKGQHIANVGNTGRSTGPHLHFEIQKNNVPVNPKPYIY